MNNKVEILAPAGSFESLKAAVSAGADAIYTGGTMFGARAYANNLTEEELLEAIDYVHLHGRKIYLTVNTLLKNQELEEQLYQYLLPYYKQGLDAVIVQDIGVLRFVRKHFPDMAIHASTQMTLTGVDGARFLQEEGATRVVTARELSLSEVRHIYEATDVEIESFVHGALCYCYSGQCLFSSFLGGRSGNRGQCAQPCRLMYKEAGQKDAKYLFSLKDICTLELIPELIEAGIYSFKIEGRMKKPEYVAAVTSIYKKYTDLYLELKQNGKGKKDFSVSEKDKLLLMDMYNRGGFHTGYYKTQNGREMLSLERPNHAGVPAIKVIKKQGRMIIGKTLTDLNPQDVIELPTRKGKEKPDNYTCKYGLSKGKEITISAFSDTPVQKGEILNRIRNSMMIEEIHKEYVDRKIKEKINGKFTLSVGDSAKLELTMGEITIIVFGEEVQKAVNQPMDASRIEKQMRKTGNTMFEFEHLEIVIQGDIFYPIQAMNDLRRTALEQLQVKAAEQYRRQEYPVQEDQKDKSAHTKQEEQDLILSVQTKEQFEVAVNESQVSKIYVDCCMFSHIWETNEIAGYIEAAHEKGKKIYLIMPYIFREPSRKKYESAYDQIFANQWDGMVIRNYESYGFLQRHGYEGEIILEYNMYQFNQSANAFWNEKNISRYTIPLELTHQEMCQLKTDASELIVYGHLPLMVSAGCVNKTLNRSCGKSGFTTVIDRYHKTFLVKNECDYCYNIMYNQIPFYVADKRDEIKTVGTSGVRFMFTVESKKETEDILTRYRKEQTLEGEFTRGHWKKGIK